MASLADWIRSHVEDYGQLKEGYPNAVKFGSALKKGISDLVPTTEQMKDPNQLIDFGVNNTPAGLAIKAYHGTPHKFDKFDMSKIGTGEGAQAYGHGLYFAQEPKIAEDYRKYLSENADVIHQAELNGTPIDIRDLKGVQNLALSSMVQQPNISIDDIIKTYKEGDNSKPYAKLWPEVADFLNKNRDNIKIYDEPIKQSGNLYETSIRWPNVKREAIDPLGEHHLLDWDKSLNNQSDYVKNTLNNYKELGGLNNINDSMTGKDIYNLLVSKQAKENNLTPMDIQKATKKGSELSDWLGMPGIKYLDQSSRKSGSGTSNYVMFNDEYPQITNRAGSLAQLLRGKQ